MADRKLRDIELKYIDSFCKKKDIQYIDLRIELVDHLAELVLDYQEKHPNVNFRDAFHGVYKSFGIFGFMNIAAEHEKQMQNRYWRGVWEFSKTWFTPPKVFLTICSVGILYTLFNNIQSARIPGLVALIALSLLSTIITYFQYRRNKRVLNGERSILMSGGYQGSFWYFYILFQLLLNFTGSGSVRIEFATNPYVLTGLWLLTFLFLGANHILQEKAKAQLLELKSQIIS